MGKNIGSHRKYKGEFSKQDSEQVGVVKNKYFRIFVSGELCEETSSYTTLVKCSMPKIDRSINSELQCEDVPF